MNFNAFLPYLATTAIVTYLVRAVPLVLIKKKIENRFILSFLYYMPYAVLAVMTVPAVFFATGSIVTAVAGVAVALVLAYFKKGLLTVALGASLAVFIAEMIMQMIK
ncbi:MAG: AzlD domain-containing protein [Clostridia bacterium]|nr:AzlD domain-containing protein [Clostridia bacterium]MBQ9517194.1 AzlD domain-containing protein [Eubacterium sp.]